MQCAMACAPRAPTSATARYGFCYKPYLPVNGVLPEVCAFQRCKVSCSDPASLISFLWRQSMSFYQHFDHARSGTSGWSKVIGRLPTRLHSWRSLPRTSCGCCRQLPAIIWPLRSARCRRQLAALCIRSSAAGVLPVVSHHGNTYRYP